MLGYERKNVQIVKGNIFNERIIYYIEQKAKLNSKAHQLQFIL